MELDQDKWVMKMFCRLGRSGTGPTLSLQLLAFPADLLARQALSDLHFNQHRPRSAGWWPVAEDDLLWEKNTVGWLVAGAELVWEKSTAGWLGASQPNKAIVSHVSVLTQLMTKSVHYIWHSKM
jgi:hypothetical protein